MRVLVVLFCLFGATPVAGETGVISFDTVVSLQRGGGRFTASDTAVKLTGELLLPDGSGAAVDLSRRTLRAQLDELLK